MRDTGQNRVAEISTWCGKLVLNTKNEETKTRVQGIISAVSVWNREMRTFGGGPGVVLR